MHELMDECVENELANDNVTKESIGKQRMHACWGACMWVRVPGQRGPWSRGLQSGLDEGLVLWCVMIGCPRRELKTFWLIMGSVLGARQK